MLCSDHFERSTTVEFTLSEELKVFQSSIRDFVVKEITREYVRECEDKAEFPNLIWDKMVKAGHMGLIVPEEYGGVGQDYMHLALFLEQIARGSQSVATYYLVSNVFGTDAIRHIGHEGHRKEYLPRIPKGRANFCFGLTEPSGGTDALSLSAYAAEVGDYFVLNGEKAFITGMDLADYVIFVARTKKPSEVAKRHQGISLFIVPTNSLGIEKRKLNKMGMHSMSLYQVFFTDVRIPKSNLLGERDQGWYQITTALNAERLSVCAINVGVQQAAFDITLEYAKQRQAFGKPIGQLQIIQHYLADMYCDLETSRMWAYRLASLASKGERFDVEAAMAKIMCTEAGKRLNMLAANIWAGHGYIKDYDIERYFRDNTISWGPISNEMCRNYIGMVALGLPRCY
jgi:acyl-CoA dehydrogenase